MRRSLCRLLRRSGTWCLTPVRIATKKCAICEESAWLREVGAFCADDRLKTQQLVRRRGSERQFGFGQSNQEAGAVATDINHKPFNPGVVTPRDRRSLADAC